MAYIKKKENGKWLARVSYNDDNGERRQPSKTFERKKDAEAWAAEKEDKINKGEYRRHQRIKLSDWLNRWIQEKKQAELAKKTLQRYEGIIRNHINPALGERLLSELSVLDLEELYKRKQKEGRLDSKDGGLSASSVRQMHFILQGALGYAVKHDYLGKNPARTADVPSRSTKTDHTTLNFKQAKTFKSLARKESPYWIVYFLALDLGARMSEILGLRWSDVDQKRKMISIKRTLQEDDRGEVDFGPLKSKDAERTISLHDSTLRDLNTHRSEQQRQKKASEGEWNPDNLICTSTAGTPIRGSNIRRDLKNLLGHPELPKDFPDITFHDFRHTCATLMLTEAGEGPQAKMAVAKTICHRLGHASVQFTLDTYVNFGAEDERALADAYASKMDPEIDSHHDPSI